MRIIDIRTGDDVKIGEWAGAPDARFRIVKVRAGLGSALVTAEFPDGGYSTARWPIRYLHPAFLFRRILFVEGE